MEETLEKETKLQFPGDFLLGAASAAHQVEGNNTKNDWCRAEQEGRLPKSGLACDHYNRYEEDFRMAKDLGLNAFRLSIEWSRIEPVEGKWNSREIEHYRQVLRALKARGLTRMVTLFHFTLPTWVADFGGFETKRGVEAFARFSWFVAENLGEEIDLWCTINEPGVYVAMGYHNGSWPPFKRNWILGIKVYHNLIAAHKAAYRAIKESLPQAQIGLAKNNSYNEPYYQTHLIDRFFTKVITYFSNEYFLDRVKEQLDFIGLNYYFYHHLRLHHKYLVVDMNRNWYEEYRHDHSKFVRSDRGWRLFPEGLYHLLRDLKKYNKPIYVAENGLADAKDVHRYKYIKDALVAVKHAMDEGVDVRGYFYWSLTDNYEWHEGFWPRFGLIEIDYETQKRTVRESAKIFKQIERK